MQVSYSTYSHKGGRLVNEDYVMCGVTDACAVFAVCDGLGGHGHGDMASDIAAHTLCGYMQTHAGESHMLYHALHTANTFILDKQQEYDYRSIKSTAVILYIGGGGAQWAHLGDSRLYHVRDGVISAVTVDHSVTYSKYLSGEITYNEINHDEDRSHLLGALGNAERFAPTIAEPVALRGGDAFVLCTDGFWEYVYDDELLCDWHKSATPKAWIDYMLLRHVRRSGDSYDNLSVVAIMVED